MKILKKVIYVFCFMLLVPLMSFALPSQSAKAEAENELPIFGFVTISQQGQTIKTEHIKTIGESAYVIANSAVTISLKPLSFNYYFENPLDETNYYPLKYEKTYTKKEDGTYDTSFEFIDGKTYYYRIPELTLALNIYDIDPTGSVTISPVVSSLQSSIVSYIDTDTDGDLETDTRTLTIIYGYVYKNIPESDTFEFAIKNTWGATNYSLIFNKPVIKFANAENPVVQFICSGLDAGDTDYIDTTIRREQTYLNVQVDFLNNSYTETNPLYFDINNDGFIYTFELYSKEYNSQKYLFVNYYDKEKEANDQYLATKLTNDGLGGLVLDSDESARIKTDELFSLVFNQTGRYEIKIYDSTYIYGLNNPNYYATSFYIKDETVTAFENIYIVSQTFDTEGNPLEYIVSTSALNNDVLTTIKNLKNLGVDDGGNPILLENVVDKIEVRKTTFGGSSNIPTKTTYSVEDIKKQLEKSDDFVLFFSEDAYYEITIYKKNSTSTKYYEYTIVKHAKTTFSVPQVDADGEPIFDENTNKQKLDTYEASTPFKTEIISYRKNILDDMTLVTKINNLGNRRHPLFKTFINEYTISYGMERVSIDKIEIVVDDDEKKKEDKLDIECKGVGKLIVKVTFNHKTTEYELNYEEGNSTLTFTEYGTYSIELVDSMGTKTTATFSLDKKLNFSALALIILSSIIVGVVLLFVIRARGKVATR